MLDVNYSAPKFLDRSNSDFHPIHGACDSVYHRLHLSGVGTTVRHTTVIMEEEDKLWSLGIIGCDNPRSLQRIIFFYIGKRFCIREEEDMRKLDPS